MNDNMTPIDWARRPLQKYVDFKGRAPRPEYWWYTLAVVILTLLVSVIESVVGLNRSLGAYGPLSVLLMLVLLLPGLGVSVRRLHDTGRSAWWLLLLAPYFVAAFMAGMATASGSAAALGSAGIVSIVALLCAIGLLVLMVLPGQPAANRYGPSPYGEGGTATAAA